MIVWTAQCARCGKKQRIPESIRQVDEAKKYANNWQRQHNREEHSNNVGNTQSTGSEEGS